MLWAGLALAVVAAGLLWRASFMPRPRAPTLVVALLALAFSWAVEFSQLHHAPWIDALRATVPGRLVLGSTFNWPDWPPTS